MVDVRRKIGYITRDNKDMKYLINNDNRFLSSATTEVYDTSFAEFVEIIRKPNVIGSDFNKVTTKGIIPATVKKVDAFDKTKYESCVVDNEIHYKDAEGRIKYVMKDYDDTHKSVYDIVSGKELARYWAVKDGKLDMAKANVNFGEVSMLAIDFDGIHEMDLCHKFHKILSDKGLNHVIYQTSGYGKADKEDPTVTNYNFRMFFELSGSINAMYWEYASSLMICVMEGLLYGLDNEVVKNNYKNIDKWKERNNPDRLIRDISSNQPQRHQLAPYCIEGQEDNFIFLSKVDGRSINTVEFWNDAKKLYDRDLKESAKLREIREKRKTQPVNVGGKLVEGKNIIGQIDWRVFDLEDFVGNLNANGFDLIKDGNKFNGECKETHRSAHNSKELALWIENDMLVVHCSHECKYHGTGATKRFLEDNKNCISSDWVVARIDFEDITDFNDVVTLENNDEVKTILKYKALPDEFEHYVQTLDELMPEYDEKSVTFIHQSTGGGKTYRIAKSINEHIVKNGREKKKELLIVVVGNKTTQDDLETTFFSAFEAKLSDINGVSIIRSGRGIKKDSYVVITHTTYLKHIGHTRKEYELAEYVREWDGEIRFFMDEVDATLESLREQIEIGWRVTYVTDEERGADGMYIPRKHRICPSNATCKFACKDCELCGNLRLATTDGVASIVPFEQGIEFLSVYSKRGEVWKYIDTDMTENAKEFDIVSNHFDFSKKADLNYVHEEKSHKIVAYDLKEIDRGDFDQQMDDANATKEVNYISWVKRHSSFPQLIQVNGNGKRDSYIKSFDEMNFKKLREENPDSYGKIKNDKCVMSNEEIWWKEYSLTMEAYSKAGNWDALYEMQLPYHPCNTMMITFYDTDLIKYIIKKSRQVIGFSATYSDNIIKIINDVKDDKVVKYKHAAEPSREMKPIDDILIITSEDSYKLDVSYEYKVGLHNKLKSYIYNVNNNIDDDLIGLQLYVDPTRDDYNNALRDKLSYKLDYNNFYLTNNLIANTTDMKDTRYYINRTYAKSSYTRGYNAAQHHSIKFSFGNANNMPMTALGYAFDNNSRDLRNSHKISETIQTAGRILRKRYNKAKNKKMETVSGIERRCIFVSDCWIEQYNPQGSNTMINVEEDIAKILADGAKALSKNSPLHVKTSEKKFLNKQRWQVALDNMVHTYLESGVVIEMKEELDEKVVNIPFSEAIREYKNIFSVFSDVNDLKTKWKELYEFINSLKFMEENAENKSISERTLRYHKKKIREYQINECFVTLSKELLEKYAKILTLI